MKRIVFGIILVSILVVFSGCSNQMSNNEYFNAEKIGWGDKGYKQEDNTNINDMDTEQYVEDDDEYISKEENMMNQEYMA